MTLGYEIWGRGELLVVALHGFTGNRQTWDHLRPHWEKTCRVLAVDLPGHGQTPVNPQTTFAQSVEELLALVEAQGFVSANLLGYSLGARVALGAAINAPTVFSRLVLESGSPGLNRRKARVERRREDEQLARSIEEKGVPDFVERWEAHPLFTGLRELPEPTRSELRARRLDSSVEGLAGSLRALGTGSMPNFWPELPAVRLPTLLLTGERDTKYTEIAKRMAGELPSAWRKTFKGVGHTPHLEAAEEYAAEVLSFIQTPWMEDRHVERELGSK